MEMHQDIQSGEYGVMFDFPHIWTISSKCLLPFDDMPCTITSLQIVLPMSLNVVCHLFDTRTADTL